MNQGADMRQLFPFREIKGMSQGGTCDKLGALEGKGGMGVKGKGVGVLKGGG